MFTQVIRDWQAPGALIAMMHKTRTIQPDKLDAADPPLSVPETPAPDPPSHQLRNRSSVFFPWFSCHGSIAIFAALHLYCGMTDFRRNLIPVHVEDQRKAIMIVDRGATMTGRPTVLLICLGLSARSASLPFRSRSIVRCCFRME